MSSRIFSIGTLVTVLTRDKIVKLIEVAQGGAEHQPTVESLRRFAKHVMLVFSSNQS
jgi:hypothetical protein